MELSTTALFRGICKADIPSLLHCLGATQKYYKKGDLIFAEGTTTEHLGIVLTGWVLIQYSDVWGSASILGSADPGDTFGEAYACCPEEPLQISAVAAADTTVLLLNVNRVMHTCPHACTFHASLIGNLLSVCAHKNLELSRRMLHTTPKTIRGRLLSYFSECVKRAKSAAFTLPYNRQQLADYLGVDRSALCSELSKMQKDGLLHYERNRVEICHAEALPFF